MPEPRAATATATAVRRGARGLDQRQGTPLQNAFLFAGCFNIGSSCDTFSRISSFSNRIQLGMRPNEGFCLYPWSLEVFACSVPSFSETPQSSIPSNKALGQVKFLPGPILPFWRQGPENMRTFCKIFHLRELAEPRTAVLYSTLFCKDGNAGKRLQYIVRLLRKNQVPANPLCIFVDSSID